MKDRKFMNSDIYFRKKYGRYSITEPFLVVIFLLVYVFVIVVFVELWMDEIESYLSKIGTFTSITGVFLGTFIASWLINQNRNKNIEENFYYKIEFLRNLHGILNAVFGMCFQIDVEIHQGTNDVKKIEEKRNQSIEEFRYWEGQINKINSNSYVPAYMRSQIALLLHQGIKPISNAVLDVELQRHQTQTTVLTPLERIFGDSYFIDDSDKEIVDELKQCNEWKDRITDAIKSINKKQQ